MKKIKQWNKRKIKYGIGIPVVLCLLITFICQLDISAYIGQNGAFLGDCIEYGIVCNFLNQTSDMETNFAAVKYQGNGQYIGNTISEDKANAAGMIKVGEIVDELKVRNNPVIVTGPEVAEEVKNMIASVQNYSESVIYKEDVTTELEIKDQNNYIIDISEIKNDLVYVNADNLVYNINNNKIANGGLKIKVRADQTIVLNITEKDKVEIPRYTLNVADGNKTNEEKAETVIWNMPFVNNLQISSDGLRATLIAPQAYVNLNVTAEGWLVCDTIVGNNGEWHMISKSVPEVTQTPNTTPTSTPTEAPVITPTETPTPAATNTPIITKSPEPTDTVVPTKTPVATTETPKVTETPKITNTPIITESPKPTEIETVTPTKTSVVTETPIPTESIISTPTETPDITIIPTGTASAEVSSTPTEELATATPSSTATATSSNAIVDIEEDDIPKNSGTQISQDKKSTNTKKTTSTSTTTLLDDDVPLSDSAPETGDSAPIGLAFGVMIFSLFVIIVILYRRKGVIL